MEVLAIDPGTSQSAFVIYDGTMVWDKGIIDNEEMLNTLYLASYDVCHIEMVASYGMAVGRDVFETCTWIGRFIEAAYHRNMEPEKIYRKDVKMWHCQSMRAKDSNIRQALINKYGKPGTKKNPNKVYQDSSDKMSKDIWSAFAIATMYFEKNDIGC